MAEFIVQGDVAAAVVKLLLAASEVTAVTSNISTDLRGYDRLTNPLWVKVERHGGNVTFPFRVDRPRVDIEVHSTNRKAGHDLAAICQAAIFRAAGVGMYQAVDCQIFGAKIESGILTAPDSDKDGSYRHIFSIRLSSTPK